MNPVIIGNAYLYKGDSLEVMHSLDNVDLVLTDPPYGVRNDYWDKMTEIEFSHFSMKWLSKAKDISQEMMAFGYAGNALHKLCEMIYPNVRLMTWTKPPGSQLSGASERNRWFASEHIFHCYEDAEEIAQPKNMELANLIRLARETAGLSKGGVDMLIKGKKTGICYRWEEAACIPSEEDIFKLKKHLQLSDEFDKALEKALEDKQNVMQGMKDRMADKSDVLSYRTVNKGRHPCEKPVALIAELINSSGGSYQTILDPFMGSCSTGEAALSLGKKFIGIGQDPKYFDIACERIYQLTAQERLFA
jgi:DNA modification methylase